jgi:cholesterol transport system auxiliary component
VGRAALVMLCAAAGGCTGSLFQSKAAPLSTYLLSADLTPRASNPAPDSPPAAAGDLTVQRPRIRTGLDSDRIALLYPDRRLDFYADARWSGPLDQVLQDLIVQAFETGAHLHNVSVETSAFPTGYRLEVRVRDFQAEYPATGSVPTVHVHFLVRLAAPADRRVLATFDTQASATAADNRLSAIVEAYERAASAALSEMVQETTRALSAASEHR